MKHYKISLKWRLTLLSLFIMIVTSGILLAAINYDITKSMPALKDTIIGGISVVGETDQFQYSYGTTPAEPLFPESIPIPIEEYVLIDNAFGQTTSNLYSTSIITFICIMIVGGITTYFIVNKALQPILDLNEKVKLTNENNLNHVLDVKGPNDEIKELTLSFNKMLAKLENAFTSQKRFNSSVAHELKTPLAVMKTNIDVLMNNDHKTNEDYEQTLAVVEKSVLKMNLVIETMLDLMKQESQPFDDSINVCQIIDEVVEDLDLIAKKKQITLETDLEDISDCLLGNEVLFYRAIYNVVENAIKYNKPNGHVNVSCRLNEEADSVVIEVTDTGKGIAEKNLANIFQPFYRCDELNVSQTSGIGLGLSLTESAIKMHGGDIKVRSILGIGSHFIITLPLISTH